MSSFIGLFDTLLEPCFILNAEMKIVYANETATVVCGQNARRLQKSTFLEIFTFSETLDWMLNIKEVAEPQPYREVTFETSQGGTGKVQVNCQPLPVAEGEDPKWIVFVRDVTLEERLQNKYRGELEQKEGYIVELQNAKAELENYSKNLEKMVEERTAEIRGLNTLMSALLDSLNQGFFVFDKEGQCLDFSSKACEAILEGRPNKRPAWQVLGLPEARAVGFGKWLSTVYSEMLPFEDLAPLGPDRYPHSEGRQISLEYFPLRSEQGIDGIIVVASDITSLVEAQAEAQTERENAKLILNLLNKRRQIGRFVRESRPMLSALTRIMGSPVEQWDPDEIFRALHTIKGGSASFNIAKAAAAAHEAETLLSKHRADATPESAKSLKEQVDILQTSFQEFIEETSRILGASAFSEERFAEVKISHLEQVCEALIRSSASLSASIRSEYLLESAASLLEPYDNVVQNTAASLGKSVAPLDFADSTLPISSEVYGYLFATLVHAFRNAVDHGIESPSVREERGKSPEGKIQIRVHKLEGFLAIEVQDDGNGIDPVRIRKKLTEKGIDCSKESDHEVIQHVFDSSFSTAEAVTETSGRGVGMDSIRMAARELEGDVEVISTLGQGSLLKIMVPWRESAAAKNQRLNEAA